MVLWDIVGFILSCIILVKSADYAIKSLTNVARILRVKEFVISLVLVGIISSLPESSIAVISAIKGDPAIGFGALIGSNIADLSIVLGLVVLVGGRMRIKSKFVSHEMLHMVFILLPFILAYDGVLSRIDGIILVAVCILFIIHLIRQKYQFVDICHHFKDKPLRHSLLMFLLSIAVLILSANFVVKFTESLSADFIIPPVTIALILIGLGTCLPEMMFAIRSLRRSKDELALGDILGNVIIDATLVLGITALISPIYLTRRLILVTGAFSALMVMMVLSIIQHKNELSENDGILMVFLYIVFVFTEMALKNVA